jgi:pimeloyl-ACP methyl ester carboxylesterase
MAAEGVAFSVLLGLEGSAAWQAARVLVALMLTVLAVWFTRRARRAGQGATALMLGVAGTASGGGVAGAHLAKAGLDAAGVLAGIAAVTGVFLLIWGTVALVRAVPGWWRLLAIPAALSLLWFVLYPLTMAVIATNRPPGSLGTATPATYGLTYHSAAFRTADGVRLSAWYIPARNGAAVVLPPGSGSTRTAVLAQAAALARHGYGALLIDERGHGLSGGHAMDFGWQGGRDIAAAVSFLERQPDVSPAGIAMLGESMGGEQALAVMGSDPRIRAVVAEGVSGMQVADKGWLPQGIDGVLQRSMEWVQYTAAGLLTGAPPAGEHSRLCPRGCSAPGADHRRHRQSRRADRGAPVPGSRTRHRTGVGGSARWPHPGPGHGTARLGEPRDRFLEHGPAPSQRCTRAKRRE